MSTYDYTIEGSDLQMVEVALRPGQGLCAEAGAMWCIWKMAST